jgi:hypothetical protein
MPALRSHIPQSGEPTGSQPGHRLFPSTVSVVLRLDRDRELYDELSRQTVLLVMQQIIATGAPSIHTAVISVAPLLLAHCVAPIRVRIDRVIENGIAVTTTLSPTMLKISATDFVAIGRSIHTLFGSSASSNQDR